MPFSSNGPKTKVLHLIDSGGLYGAEKMLLALCLEQNKQGIKSTILSCGHVGEAEKPVEKEARKHGIGLITWRMKPGLNRDGMADVWSLILDKGFNLLHSHGYKFNVLIALTRKAYPDIKALATVHGYTTPNFFSKGWFYQWADKFLLCRLDKVVYVNEFVGLPLFLKCLYGRKLTFISNGIDLTELSGTTRPHRDYSKSISRLLIVGRLSPEKGHVYALHALSELLKLNEGNVEKYTLAIAGDGPLKAELQRLATDLNIQSSVDFLGFVEDMDSLYRNYDALLMPSLTEGLPITLLEAVKFGMPVFASPVGGITKFFEDTSEMFLLSEDRAESLVELIGRWQLQEHSVRSDATARVIGRLTQKYSLSAMVEGYFENYKECWMCR